MDKAREILGLSRATSADESASVEQDCLVAVCAKHFTFYWKDESVEKLAPLRHALLDTFGPYQRACTATPGCSILAAEFGLYQCV